MLTSVVLGEIFSFDFYFKSNSFHWLQSKSIGHRRILGMEQAQFQVKPMKFTRNQ